MALKNQKNLLDNSTKKPKGAKAQQSNKPIKTVAQAPDIVYREVGFK